MEFTLKQIAKSIDHSLLHPTMTDAEMIKGCEDALKYDVAAVCVKPYFVAKSKELLKDSDVKVCSVIGFPHGNSTTKIKVLETKMACKDGATEIDMVVNIGKVIEGDWKYVKKDIVSVNKECIKNGAILKVIFENDYLNDKQKIKLCKMCSAVKVAFIKTSSGYSFVKQANGDYNYKGATVEDIKLMKKHSSPEMQIKAAGGVRNLDGILQMMQLGCTRIGASATEAILKEAGERGIQ